jgi:hypothetical protein
MDGNLAALNEHLASLDAEDYEQEWKAGYINDFVETTMYQLKTEGSFTFDNGFNYKPLDFFCESEEEVQDAANAALLSLMFNPLESKKSSTNLDDLLAKELEKWVDVNSAYEQHVKDNEPQEY